MSANATSIKLEIPPLLGFGTYRMNKDDLEETLEYALLECNYQLIDTARAYRNEKFIGVILKRLFKSAKLHREAIFITSKLSPKDQGYQSTLKSVEASLEDLQLDYIDLYLIHWPGASSFHPSDQMNAILRKESWKALEECQLKGKIHHIGVSNYSKMHLKEMQEYAVIKPLLHQFELHPLYFPTDIIKYCDKNEIIIQAYGSFGEGHLFQSQYAYLMPQISQLAKKYRKNEPQILLRWAVQHNFLVIPKSCKKSRIKENSLIFDFSLSFEEMKEIDSISINNKICHKFCWDSSNVT